MLDKNGYEIPDDTPVSIPTRLKLPQSRASQIQGFIRAEMSRMAEDQGHESFDEADDLDVDEMADFPPSPYELAQMDGYLDSPADAGGPPEAGGAAPGGATASPGQEGAQPPADGAAK